MFEERTHKKRRLKAHHWIFEMEIEEIAKKFPEKKKRERRWFTFEESLAVTHDHPYIQEALFKSSLNPMNTPTENCFLSPRNSVEKIDSDIQVVEYKDSHTQPLIDSVDYIVH